MKPMCKCEAPPNAAVSYMTHDNVFWIMRYSRDTPTSTSLFRAFLPGSHVKVKPIHAHNSCSTTTGSQSDQSVGPSGGMPACSIILQDARDAEEPAQFGVAAARCSPMHYKAAGTNAACSEVVLLPGSEGVRVCAAAICAPFKPSWCTESLLPLDGVFSKESDTGAVLVRWGPWLNRSLVFRAELQQLRHTRLKSFTACCSSSVKSSACDNRIMTRGCCYVVKAC